MTAAYPLSTDAQSPTGRVAFIQSAWHKPIVDQCHAGFAGEIAALGYSDGLIDRFEVPGAFEIPLHAKRLARTGRYAAIVAAGFVVDGGIYRHEFVAQTVIAALMQVQLETDVPVFSAVLTPKEFHEHEVHAAFFTQHMWTTGAEAARACAMTLESLRRVPAFA